MMKKSQSTIFQTWNKKKTTEQSNDIKGSSNNLFNGCGSIDIFDDLNEDIFDDELVLSNHVKTENDKENHIYLEPVQNYSKQYEKIEGFDEEFGKTYIYPTNYPIRDYQFNIIQKALLKNTMVVLPTGLGKTFIAAVVMYNFYRWYPQGKIIFMAPTKPLVAQQINACYEITGIPHKDTAEMTGSMNPPRRAALWKSKRVFFLTPQVMQNDLARGTCFASDVVCLVFDEAHRALGNHAYCQVVKDVMRHKKNFRILALSATPGDDMKAVQQVIDNLLIAKIEIRSEDSIDIQKYLHERKIEKIVVPMSAELKKTRSVLMKVLETIVQRLYSRKAIWQSDCEKVSKYILILAREQWRVNNANRDRVTAGYIEGDFALLISLYHSLDVLMMHGILSFYIYMKGILAGTKGTSRGRSELNKHTEFMELMEELHSKIEGDQLNQTLNESIIAEKNLNTKQRLLKTIPKPKSNFQSHPKLQKLEEIVVDHFRRYQKENIGKDTRSTRIMIFSQFRDSVQEITSILSKHEPLVKPMSFVGQGSKEGSSGKTTKGLSQKEQIEILRRFRDGGYNTVISTSVGEEGLDIGEVDLIICFDVSSSPIRLVQRMGRTGRKRKGKIIVLVTEGKEESTYKKSISNKKGIHKSLVNAAKSLTLFDENPRMVPAHLNPLCYKMNITFPDEVVTQKNSKSSSKAAKMNSKPSCTKTSTSNISNLMNKGLLTNKQMQTLENKYYGDKMNCSKCQQLQRNKQQYCSHIDFRYPLSLFEWRNWQTSEQSMSKISHSKTTQTFCYLMEHYDNMKDTTVYEPHEKKLKETFHAKKVKGVCKFATKEHSESFDSDFEEFQGKIPVQTKSNVNEDKLKPCPFEELFEEVSNSLKLKKQKPRLTKLPKIEPKIADDIACIEDNQLDFCSQISMDTLFNRCQQKRKSFQSDKLEDIDEKEIFNNSIDQLVNEKCLKSANNLLDETLLHLKYDEIPSDVEVDEKFQDNIFCGEKNANEEVKEGSCSQSQDLFPMSTQAKDIQKRRKVCIVSPIVNTTLNKKNITNTCIPEPPFDFVSDNISNNMEKNKIVHDDNRMSNVFTKVNTKTTDSLTNKKLHEGRPQGTEKKTGNDLEMDILDNDDLFAFFNDDIDDGCMSSSPPIVSQAPLKTKFKSPENLINTDNNLKEKKNNISVTSPLNGSENDESPLFRKKQKRKVCIFDSQPVKSDSEESDDSIIQAPSRKKKRIQNNTKKKVSHSGKAFIEMEAVEDDDVEDSIEDCTADATTINGYLKDSFINDETIDTPFPQKIKQRNDNPSVDMNAVYKQSLMSPNNNILRFQTPSFKANRNRFKLANLAEKYAQKYDSDESSEAEEVMGLVQSDEECSSPKALSKRLKARNLKSKRDVLRRDSFPKWCKVFQEYELPPLTFSFDVDWLEQGSNASNTTRLKSSSGVSNNKSHTKSCSINEDTKVKKPRDIENMKTISKVRLNPTKKNLKGKTPIFIDSKCMNNPQIASILRADENYNISIVPQLACDIVISLRCGVFRRTVSELSNTSNMHKFIASWHTFNEIYSLGYLIIENDRVKAKQVAPKQNLLSNNLASFLSKLCSTSLQIVYSKSQEDSCLIIKRLSEQETEKGFAIQLVDENRMKPSQKQMMTSLQCMPKLTHPIALEIIQSYSSISQILNSSLSEFKSKLKRLRSQTLAEMYFFFQRRFDITMIQSNKL